jgi:hypothetical protein
MLAPDLTGPGSAFALKLGGRRLSTETAKIAAPRTIRGASRTHAASFPAEAIRFPVLVWAVHWLLVTIPASLAYHYGTSRPETESYVRFGRQEEGGASWAWGQELPPMSGLAHWLVEPMRLWDGSWYRTTALDWYAPGPGFSANAAFFPLYPKLMSWGSQITGWSVETVGYIISNVTFLGALILLYRLVTIDFNDSVARRTIWALALFPTALFFTAVYTESLFLLLAVATLYAARRGEWLIAGVAGLLAALTRSAGVMLLAPMAVLFLQQYGWNPRRWFPNAIPAALPALGPVIFGWILTRNEMKFFDWVEQQWQWNRFSATPWKTFDCTLNGCRADVRQFGETRNLAVNPIDWSWIGDFLSSPTWTTFTSFEWRDRVARSDVFEFIVTIAAFALVLIGIKRLPLYYLAFVVPPLIVPLFSPSSVHPLMSMPRFVLPLFPLFVMAVLLIRNRKVAIGLATASGIGLVLFSMQFASWYWVS